MTKELKKLRVDFDLTQSDVANFLGFKETSSYTRRENGDIEFSQSEIKKLIKLFKLNTDRAAEIFLT